ncbi:MAG TPA: VWA domain-containing protein [Fibrobacteria bacterium]|nr:VWA domain-containing protein [Fibrobacteria bacterium]HOX50418.1 VWA domain-containing protein [Fibrobacteria bacterium]
MITWANPERLTWLWGIFLWAAALVLLSWHRRRARRALADTDILPRVVRGDSPALEIARIALAILAAVFVVLALARPQYGEMLVPAPAKGADVVLVVDASLSMLASDVAPDRLGLARRDLRRLVDSLGPSRIGLVGFAGTAIRQIPLTEDRAALATLLDALGPDLLPTAGTDIAPAIATTRAMMERSQASRKVVVLVSDGGDHGQGAIDEARRLSELGVEFYVMGVGGPVAVPIPLPEGGTKEDGEGNIVTVKLESETLRNLAEAGRGKYAELSPLSWNLSGVLNSVNSVVAQGGTPGMRLVRVDRYAWFLLVAMLLMAAELVLPHGRKQPC